MSRLAHLSARHDPCRSASPVSIAASDTTYHSFQDIELYAPKSPPASTDLRVIKPMPTRGPERYTDPVPMRRQDSGYASIPSGSKSGSSHGSSRRRRSTASSHSSHTKVQTRPAIHRASKSTPSPHNAPALGHTIHRTRSQQHQRHSYYHFPSLEGIPGSQPEPEPMEDVPMYTPPPQTTHYWTSDHTRRLEYAAIDAASRGVKGWVLRHMVPDCFVPKSNRRLTFDDDTGSVRRYRLELECDEQAEKQDKPRKRRFGWLFGR
ncbi:uncharacterized protein B0I36DRAFT_344621 [Microdochium trichocladiopsis]|uniref:Uncharacterized protein n=1 Tax=Microdochium trichocladiopsis TaxID=1682393 RepID=A0A9P8YJC4_9PEZI|nr:uncharacterized protein B0I36DRAFT_344621 [Microdochium trichocladiopsis]KAH7040968.1 hypothetical protein B0I36DRAFT_344621 [Microdochium trichocladiopsis]